MGAKRLSDRRIVLPASSRTDFALGAAPAERIAARLKKVLLEAFLAGSNALQRPEFLEALMSLGSEARVLAETLWSQSGGEMLWSQGVELLTAWTSQEAVRTGEAAHEVLPKIPVVTLEAAFNVVDERVIHVVRESAGEQIRHIDTRTREGLRAIIEHTWREGLSVQEFHDAIAAQVGMTPAQVQSLRRYYQQLLGDGETPARALALLQERAKHYRLVRAEAIARTETLAASNRAQHLYWEELTRQGLLNSATVRRHWLVARDERLCKVCVQVPKMNPRGVALQQPFMTPVGLRMYPPLHVVCRCTATLQFMN